MTYRISMTDPTTDEVMGTCDWDFPFVYNGDTGGSIAAMFNISFDDAGQAEQALGRTICSLYGMKGGELIALLRSRISDAHPNVLLELLRHVILFPDGVVQVGVVTD